MCFAVEHNLLIVNWCDWKKKKKKNKSGARSLFCFYSSIFSPPMTSRASRHCLLCRSRCSLTETSACDSPLTHSCKRELSPSCCCSHTHRCCMNTGTNAATLNLSTLEIGSHTQGFAACRVLVPTWDDSVMSQLAFTFMDQHWSNTVTDDGWTVEIDKHK